MKRARFVAKVEHEVCATTKALEQLRTRLTEFRGWTSPRRHGRWRRHLFGRLRNAGQAGDR
jgi:hypothetical protein